MKRRRLKQALMVPLITVSSSLTIVDNSYRLDSFSCGPEAIRSVLRKLNPGEEYVLEKIGEIRWGREPIRNLLSLFDKDALSITWPWEMEKIFEGYGYEVRRESNPLFEATSGEKARLERIAKKETREGNHVVVQTLKRDINQRHWECYDPDTFLERNVYSILIVSEKK
jgi:hypothetical protein